MRSIEEGRGQCVCYRLIKFTLGCVFSAALFPVQHSTPVIKKNLNKYMQTVRAGEMLGCLGDHILHNPVCEQIQDLQNSLNTQEGREAQKTASAKSFCKLLSSSVDP
jgi:hypothetical protein